MHVMLGVCTSYVSTQLLMYRKKKLIVVYNKVALVDVIGVNK